MPLLQGARAAQGLLQGAHRVHGLPQWGPHGCASGGGGGFLNVYFVSTERRQWYHC